MIELIRRNEKIFYVFLAISVLSFFYLKNIVFQLGEFGDRLDDNPVFIKLIFGLGFILLIRFYLPKWLDNYIFDPKITFGIVYITYIFLILRFFFDTLIFYPYDFPLKYLDIIFLWMAFHASVLIKTWHFEFKKKSRRKRKSEKGQNYFLQDTLHVDGEIDNERILNDLFYSLNGFKPENSFSIGLNAVWGYGKSTFLNKFEERYKKEIPQGIVFWNHIWKNRGSQAIIENFFQELKQNLKPHSSAIANNIDHYVKAILSLAPSDISKFFNQGLSFISENQTLEKYYTEINRNIKIIDRQIIILLDDLDRLEKDEILSTLKLIRTISDFNNIIFIAGYDRNYVTKNLPFEDERYLEKVFNVEINLLPFETERIRRELVELANKQFPIDNSSKLNQKLNFALKTIFDNNPKIAFGTGEINFTKNIISSKVKLDYQQFLTTFRDVKRFLNEFKFNYNFIEDEEDIIIEEYVLLKLCTYRYRILQNLIFVAYEGLFSLARIDDVNGKLEKGNYEFFDVLLYDEEAQKKIQEILKKSGLKDDDIDIIDAVLIRLFGQKPIGFYRTAQNSIAKIYHADLYIRNDIAGGNISYSKMRKAHKKNHLFEIALEITEKGSSKSQLMFEMKQFLLKLQIKSVENFKDVYRSLNQVMTSVSLKEDYNIFQALDTILEEIYKSDKDKMLDDIVEIISIKKLGYLDNLLATINQNLKRRKRTDIYDNIFPYSSTLFTEEVSSQLLFQKLNFAIKEELPLNDTLWLFFQNVEAIILDKKILHSRRAIELMKVDIERKFFIYFITNTFDFHVDRHGHGEDEFVYRPNYYLSEIFSNEDEYKELLIDPTVEKYERFQKNGWDNYYNFLEQIEKIPAQSGEYNQERFNKIKILTHFFIKKGRQPLSSQEFHEIWDQKPKALDLYEIF